jgi:type II secretory pathway component PulF
MASFHFKAIASDGKVRVGSLTAPTEKAVAAELRNQGLTPVYVGAEATSGFSLKMPAFGGNSRKDVLLFTKELSTLLNAGVPVDRALSIASDLTEKDSFKTILQDVIRVLKGGKSLADSLAGHPEHFSDLYVNMVRAGEASGSLSAVFDRLSEFEKTRDDLRNYIVSSMVYPVLLMIVGLGSILVLMYFVVPRFASVFEQSSMEMPLPTKMLLGTSEFLQSWGWIGILAIIGGAVGLRMYVRTQAGRMWWDTIRLRVPLLGDALRKAETARFASAMSTLVANSVPLVQSIGIAGAILNNRKIAGALDSVAQGVKRGEGIAGPLKKTAQFPALAGHLLAVGEETGRLDHMFAQMAEIYETDTRAAIRRFTALFEPLIILVLGVVVGILVLSMMLAITSINEVAV